MLMLYANVTTTADDMRDRRSSRRCAMSVDWLLFPVIFYEIARRQTWLGNYPRYIAALNWINLHADHRARARRHPGRERRLPTFAHR